MEVKLETALAARLKVAELDAKLIDLAPLVGISDAHLSRVLKGRRHYAPVRIRIERAIEEVERQRAADAERPAPVPRVRRIR